MHNSNIEIMDKILLQHSSLIDVYRIQIEKLETPADDVGDHSKAKSPRWSAFGVLNSRVFLFDEWLTNPYHLNFCYEEKKAIIEPLIKFISAYNKLSEEDRVKFDQKKVRNSLQENFDELWTDKIDFLEFTKRLKKEREERKMDINYPSKPSRPNAHRQWNEFERLKKIYWEEVDSEKRCIEEIKVWEDIFNSVSI